MASRHKNGRALRMLLAGVAAATLVLTGAMSASAEADPTLSISGHVTREDDGTPVAGVAVYASGVAGGGVGVTDENGDYTVAGLAPDSYVVEFSTASTETGLVSEYWDGALDWQSASRVDVGSDDVTGIDASLQLGGSISGVVTRESDGTPVEGVNVQVAASGRPGLPVTAFTDADGAYRVRGLVPGPHVVAFTPVDAGLAREYWDGAPDEASATLVTVTAGEESSGIDASLVSTATISGHVTRETDGAPVGGGSVTAFGDAGYASTTVSPDGSYSLSVAPGTYGVQFSGDTPRLLTEFWQNARTEAESTPVTVVSGQSLVLDAALEAGMAITGTVTAQGAPLADAIVEAWADGSWAGMAYAHADGTYELIVPAGDYVVSAKGETYNPIYATQYYESADSASEATPVSVVTGADAEGIDFDLSLGGDLQGTVTGDGAALPDEGAVVTAYLWSGGDWRAVATVHTADRYGFASTDPEFPTDGGPLPAGTYVIGVEAEGFCPQFFGEASEFAEAETIDLAEGEVLTGIDVVLSTECAAPVARLDLTSSTVRAGGTIAVTGENFAPGESVAFELHSEPIALGSLTADASGRISGSLLIPVTAPVGSHTLVARGAQSELEASIALHVLAAAGSGGDNGPGSGGVSSPPTKGAGSGLAETGGGFPAAVLLAGLFAVVAGGVLVRRRVHRS